MKKLLTAMVGVSLLACLLLTACGGDKPAAGNSGDSSTSTPASSSEPGNTDDQDDDGGDNVAQAIVDQSQDQLASLQQEGMTVELVARDPNTLVYLYTLSEGVEPAPNADELLEQQSAIFTAIASQMEQMGAKDAKVIIEYVNGAGEVVFTKTFEKE